MQTVALRPNSATIQKYRPRRQTDENANRSNYGKSTVRHKNLPKEQVSTHNEQREPNPFVRSLTCTEGFSSLRLLMFSEFPFFCPKNPYARVSPRGRESNFIPVGQ